MHDVFIVKKVELPRIDRATSEHSTLKLRTQDETMAHNRIKIHW